MNDFKIEAQFDSNTFTLTYIVWDSKSKDAVIIDPVLDFDSASGTTSTHCLEKLTSFIDSNKLNVHYVLETHAHADHISSAHKLKESHYPNAKIGIGKEIVQVQKTFHPVFNMGAGVPTDGSQFDHLFSDGECVQAGSLKFEVLFTPGHTPACTTIKIGDALFVGDAIFMPDFGTGRCDFPAGDATALYRSIKNKIYSCSNETRVFVGHDYQPGGRDLAFETTVGEEKITNIHMKAETTEEDFVKFRNERDKVLKAPRLLLPSIQINIAAGELPIAESNGQRYLKLPLTLG